MKSPWLRWLSRIAVLASFGLIGWFLWKNADELRGVDWDLLTVPVLLGLLLYGLALGLQGAVWIELFSILTSTPWTLEDVKTYFMTHLMRRLPGAPWYMAGRAAVYRERSPEASRAALAVSFVEWGGIILSGLPWLALGCWGWGAAVLAFCLLLLVIVSLRHWKWPRRWVALDHFSFRSLATALVMYESQWLLAAIILHLLLRALTPAYAPDFLETGAIWAMSGIVSSLAVFAPAGLGIRELSLVGLLESTIGLSYAMVVALLMRVIFTIGDMLWGMLVWLAFALGTRKK